MGKIVGVGGVFLSFKGDDQEIRDWYEEHLGVNMSPYGTSFIEGDQITLVSFTRESNSNTPTINFRVDNLEEIMVNLKHLNCEIINEIAKYPYGDFAQFIDPFGNAIELWEPNIDEYRKMVKDEIKTYKNKKSNN